MKSMAKEAERIDAPVAQIEVAARLFREAGATMKLNIVQYNPLNMQGIRGDEVSNEIHNISIVCPAGTALSASLDASAVQMKKAKHTMYSFGWRRSKFCN